MPMVRAAGFLDDRIFWFCRRCGSNNRYTVHLSCQQAGLWGHSQSVKIFLNDVPAPRHQVQHGTYVGHSSPCIGSVGGDVGIFAISFVRALGALPQEGHGY